MPTQLKGNLTKSLIVSISAKGKRVRGVLMRLKREREVKIKSAVSLFFSGSLSRNWVSGNRSLAVLQLQ